LLSNKIAKSVFSTLVQAPVKAEHELVTKRGYVCAANNNRQKKAACTKPSNPSEISHHSSNLDGITGLSLIGPEIPETGGQKYIPTPKRFFSGDHRSVPN